MNALPLLALFVSPAIPEPPAETRYVREGESWVRVEPYGEFRVDPEVVSARFLPDVEGLDGFLRQLDARSDASLALLGGLRVQRANHLGVHDLRVPPGADVLEVVRAMRATGLVEFAEENCELQFLAEPDDPTFGLTWHLGGAPGIDVVEAWDLTTGSPDIVIATADTGVDLTHEDLTQNVWTNPGEIPGNGVDDDGNGFEDDVTGWNFSQDSPNVTDFMGHGTGIAGILGARTNNGVGASGVAGGFDPVDGCRYMPLRIGPGAGQNLDDAILYAADNGAHILSLSVGVPESAAINAAIDYARNVEDLLILSASGNNDGPVGYPPKHPDVVAIGASDQTGGKASFSNFGPELSVIAPGVGIWTTKNLGGTQPFGGTSAAAPVAAATAGLVLSVLPGLTADEVVSILEQTADDVGTPGYDEMTGHGRIDAHAAVLHAALSDCDGDGRYDPSQIAESPGLDANGNGILDSCESLVADASTLSVSGGGSVAFALDAGPAHGAALYLMLGSATGTEPGVVIDGTLVPLVPDAYLDFTLVAAGSSFFPGSVGVLDASGEANAGLDLPASSDPVLAGLTLHHAFVAFGPAGDVALASDPELLDLLP